MPPRSPAPDVIPDTDRAAGITWGDLVSSLIQEHGTLTQVAWKLVEQADRAKTDLDVASVERALRRLRTRGQRDGGAWGQRLVRMFGMPAAIEDRVRWLGHYHSPFNDLPVALCLDQLRLWDRPPMSGSRTRLWIQLGLTTCALRTRRIDDARVHVRRVAEALAPLGVESTAARIELALVEGFLASRDGGDVDAALERAASLLATAELTAIDRACFEARLADQRAYQRNKAGDHAAGLEIYEALPKLDTHPFASYRRDAGLAYGYHHTGRPLEALVVVMHAIEHAGDGGYTRLRAMGLLMLSRITDDPSLRTSSLARARAIGTRLGDDELLARAAKLADSVPR